MPVTEALMKPGSFEIELSDQTPRALRERIDFFDRLFIFPTRVDLNASNATGSVPGYAQAMYAGRIDGFENSRRVIKGLGNLCYFGDDEHKGAMRESLRTYVSQSFSQAITTAMADVSNLTLGTINSSGISGTITWQHRYMAARDVLDFICRRFDAEYRVSPTGVIDFGHRTTLFNWTPTHIATRIAGRGDDPITGVRGLLATTMEIDESMEGYVSQMRVLGEGEGASLVVGTANVGSNPYIAPDNTTMVVKKVVADHKDATQTAADLLAAKFLDRANDQRPSVTLETDTYAVPTRVVPGDRIMLYEPDIGFQDLTQGETRYRGKALHPLRARVYGYTWPVRQGYGVVVSLKSFFEFVDITDYVVFEDGDVTWDISRYFNSRRFAEAADASASDFIMRLRRERIRARRENRVSS